MHPAICSFPSQAFYSGKLITDDSVLQRTSDSNSNSNSNSNNSDSNSEPWHAAGVGPYTFIDVSNGHEEDCCR
jgi:superfamily I DNA and/or RNA helicase